MKTLYLLRHAKSSWSDPELPDVDRPLKGKGVAQAAAMAGQVAALLPAPGHVLCSPSARTRQTLLPFVEVWGLGAERVNSENSLYLASDRRLLDVVRALPDHEDLVMIVGHNPGLTDVANRLTPRGTFLENIPSCGLLQIDFECGSWREVKEGGGHLKFNLRPKELSR